MTEDKLSYGQAIAKVEQIVKALQDPSADVDSLASMVAQATELINYCTEKLRTAQVEVEKAVKNT